MQFSKENIRHRVSWQTWNHWSSDRAIPDHVQCIHALYCKNDMYIFTTILSLLQTVYVPPHQHIIIAEQEVDKQCSINRLGRLRGGWWVGGGGGSLMTKSYSLLKENFAADCGKLYPNTFVRIITVLFSSCSSIPSSACLCIYNVTKAVPRQNVTKIIPTYYRKKRTVLKTFKRLATCTLYGPFVYKVIAHNTLGSIYSTQGGSFKMWAVSSPKRKRKCCPNLWRWNIVGALHGVQCIQIWALAVIFYFS